MMDILSALLHGQTCDSFFYRLFAGCNSFDIHIDTFIDEDPEPLVCDIQACSAVVHISDYVFIPNNPQIRQLLPEADLKAQLSG
jgi:hypothetical protein